MRQYDRPTLLSRGMAAIGYNFRRLIAWLMALSCLLRTASLTPIARRHHNSSAFLIQAA